MKQNVEIKGARIHNLRNIDVTIPKNKLTVITGVSGSGKSSLAFDTLYEEGLRRIKEYEGLKRIIVCTNSNLAAQKNYESVGFKLYDSKPNETESAFTGDFLYYEIVL